MDDETNDLKKHIDKLEEMLRESMTRLRDLEDYLIRTDVLPDFDPGTFRNWQGQLQELRRNEEHQAEIRRTKRFLEEEGYIVAQNENELDAVKLKHWVTLKDRIKIT